MLRIVVRAMSWMSTYVSVVISPETTTSPVFTSVSHATRPYGSSRMTASRTPSEIWSAILSGWPSVTDSEVNRYSLSESCGVDMCFGDAPTVGVDSPVSRRTGRPGSLPSAVRAGPPALAAVVVDDQRHALQAVALAQAVLEEEAVVAGQQGAVVDLDREAR